jgi:hypothetical protein
MTFPSCDERCRPPSGSRPAQVNGCKGDTFAARQKEARFLVKIGLNWLDFRRCSTVESPADE